MTTNPEEDQEFLSATAHVPEEIGEHKDKDDFREMREPEILPPAAGTGWTVAEIADLFSGVFTVLVCARYALPVGGDHWAIAREQCERLGGAWLPIFQKHIPYESKPTWLPDFLLYTTVIGTTSDVIGPALAKEIAQIKDYQARKNAQAKEQNGQRRPFNGFSTGNTATGNTATATPQESPARSGSGNQERPSGSGFHANFPSID